MPKQDADGQRERKVVQRFATEDQHRQDHHLGAAVGDDGAAEIVLVMAWSSTCGVVRPRYFLKVSRTRSKTTTDSFTE